ERTAMIYISHNLGVIARIADRIAVMYAGAFVETGAARAIFHSASHPYTQALLACLPRAGITKRQASLLSGSTATATARLLDGGCNYRDRCRHRTAICEVAPVWSEVGAAHALCCWHPQAEGADSAGRERPATSVQPGNDLVLDVARLAKSFPAGTGS